MQRDCSFRNVLSEFVKSHIRLRSHLDFSFSLPNLICQNLDKRTSKRNISSSVLNRISYIFKLPIVSCSVQASSKNSAKGQLPIKMLEDEIEEFIAKESGKDRLKRAWSSRENEQAPPDEAVLILRVSQNIFLVGFMYGFFKGGLAESTAFLQRNRTTLYGSPSLANKRLANTTIGKGMGVGIKLGLKSCLATTVLLGIWRGLCVYYNTSSPWTFAVATGTILSISKVSLGPKGLAGGAIIGSVLGGMVGGLLQLILISTGKTQQQINYKQIEQKIIEKRSIQHSIQAMSDEEDEMID